MVFVITKKANSGGQSTSETIIIMAVAVLALAAIISIVYDNVNSGGVAQQQREGYAAVSTLAKEINDVYFLGPDSVREVTVSIPELADLNKSYINGSTLVLRVGGTDQVATADVNVVGDWPTDDGSNVFILTAYSDFVSVSAQAVFFSPAELTASLPQGSSSDANIFFTSVSGVDENYSAIVLIGGDVSAAYLGGNPFTITGGGEKTLEFSISCGANSAGSYAGKVVFAPNSPSDSNLSLPIKIICTSPQTKLSVLPKSKSILAVAGTTSSDSLLVCNNSQSNFTSSTVTLTGEAAKYVFASFSGDINAGSCRTLPLTINAPPQQNIYLGTLSVSAGGLISTADLNLAVTPGAVPPDSTPPTTAAAGCPSGWNFLSQTVSLECSDSGWGCRDTNYQVDGGVWIDGNSISVATDGNHVIAYKSSDLAGNVESVKTTYCAVDTIKPLTTISGCATGWIFSSQTIGLNCSDTNSGCNGTTYRIDGGAWQAYSSPFSITGEINHEIDFNSKDVAGNVELQKTSYCRVLPQPRAKYSFENNLNDSSGNGFNASSFQGSLSPGYTSLGKTGSAVVFQDGEWIGINSNVLNGLGNFTYATWLKSTSPVLAPYMDSWGSIYLYYDESQSLIQVSFNFETMDFPLTEFTDGNWHHIAVTRDGGTISIYKDCNYYTSGEGNSDTIIPQPPDDPYSPFFINMQGYETSDVLIDETYIFNEALTQPQIEAVGGC